MVEITGVGVSSVAGLELGNCWVIREGIRRRCVREWRWIKRGEDFREREKYFARNFVMDYHFATCHLEK